MVSTTFIIHVCSAFRLLQAQVPLILLLLLMVMLILLHVKMMVIMNVGKVGTVVRVSSSTTH